MARGEPVEAAQDGTPACDAREATTARLNIAVRTRPRTPRG